MCQPQPRSRARSSEVGVEHPRLLDCGRSPSSNVCRPAPRDPAARQPPRTSSLLTWPPATPSAPDAARCEAGRQFVGWAHGHKPVQVFPSFTIPHWRYRCSRSGCQMKRACIRALRLSLPALRSRLTDAALNSLWCLPQRLRPMADRWRDTAKARLDSIGGRKAPSMQLFSPCERPDPRPAGQAYRHADISLLRGACCRTHAWHVDGRLRGRFRAWFRQTISIRGIFPDALGLTQSARLLPVSLGHLLHCFLVRTEIYPGDVAGVSCSTRMCSYKRYALVGPAGGA